jgi:hypothetical protein
VDAAGERSEPLLSPWSDDPDEVCAAAVYPPTAWDTGGNHSSTARIINVLNRRTWLLEG